MASGRCGVNIFWGSVLEGRENLSFTQCHGLPFQQRDLVCLFGEAFLTYYERGLGAPRQWRSIEPVQQCIEETEKKEQQRDEEEEWGYAYGASMFLHPQLGLVC